MKINVKALLKAILFGFGFPLLGWLIGYVAVVVLKMSWRDLLVALFVLFIIVSVISKYNQYNKKD